MSPGLDPAQVDARLRAAGVARDAATTAELALHLDLVNRWNRVYNLTGPRGTEELAKKGFLLADTKFEFGRVDGRWVLIDEALTPDSSRFWPAEGWKPGESPPAWDKQILRDHLETLDWDKRPPAPELDPAVLQRLSERYLEVCEKITGRRPEGARA